MGSCASELVLVIVCTLLIFGAKSEDENVEEALNGSEDSVETDNENFGAELEKDFSKEVETINKGEEAAKLTGDPDNDQQAVPYEKKNESSEKLNAKEKGSVKKRFKRENSVETERIENSTRELAETSPCIFSGSGEATSKQNSGSDKPVTELTAINPAQKDTESSPGISKESGSEVTTIQDSTYGEQVTVFPGVETERAREPVQELATTSSGIVNEDDRGTFTHDISSSKQVTKQPAMKTKRSRKPVRKPKTKPGIFEVSTENAFTQDNSHGEQVTERHEEELPKSTRYYYNTYDDEDEAGRADFGVEVWDPETPEDPHAADSHHVPDDPATTPIDLFSLNFGIPFVIISYMFHFF